MSHVLGLFSDRISLEESHNAPLKAFGLEVMTPYLLSHQGHQASIARMSCQQFTRLSFIMEAYYKNVTDYGSSLIGWTKLLITK